MIEAFVILVLTHAAIDAWQLDPRRQWKIYHGWESAAYAFVCIVATLLFGWPAWWAVSLCITTRAALFDPALNLMRGKGLLHNGAGGSLQDRFENWTGINPLWLRIGYGALWILNVIFYYKMI